MIDHINEFEDMKYFVFYYSHLIYVRRNKAIKELLYKLKVIADEITNKDWCLNKNNTVEEIDREFEFKYAVNSLNRLIGSMHVQLERGMIRFDYLAQLIWLKNELTRALKKASENFKAIAEEVEKLEIEKVVDEVVDQVIQLFKPKT